MNRSSAFLALILAVPAAAQQTTPWEKLKLTETVKSLAFSGDLRLRHDTVDRRGPGLTDRSRLRYRLRAGIEAQLPDGFAVFLRLGSGTGEQTSTNQSFDNLSGQKALWVDQVYLRWKPAVPVVAPVLLVGRMANPLWRVYSSDLVWDEDFAPEGFGESIEWKSGSGGLALFANGVQAVADEDSNSGKSQWFFSSQVGAEAALPGEARLRAGAAYHKWSDVNRSSLGQALVQDGNRRLPNGALANRFGIGELTTQLAGKAGHVPYALQATLVRNFSARNDDVVQGPAGRDAYQFGLILGAARAAGTWEAAYFKKYAQIDSVVADVSDSDFGDSGGVNRVGHQAWVAYNPRDWLQLKVKGYVTDALDRGFPTVPAGVTPSAATNLDKAVNRFQLDASVKF